MRLSLAPLPVITVLSFSLQYRPKTDTCKTCDSYKVKIDAEKDDRERATLLGQWDLHKRKAERAYQQLREDIALSQSDTNHELLSFDLEQSLPTPVLTTNVVYYKRQLWTYNLGIHDGRTGSACMHTWHEGIASRGSNEIASCLLKHLKENVTNTEAENLVLYSDSCGGQNRNIYMVCALLYIVSSADFPFTQIDHKFMVPGHSYLPNDRDFGSVETARRRREHIYVPDHWYELIRSARQNNPFRVCVMQSSDFVSLKELKKCIVNRKVATSGQKVEWLSMKWIQVVKSEPFQFRFRYSHNSLECWKTVDLKRKTKGRPPVISHIPLPPLHGSARAIKKTKLEDLMSLLQFVPPIYHDFYKSLQGADEVQSESEEED